jgi:RNA ligase.
MEQFIGREIVVTEKMDGENTTMARDYFHARSLDSRHHPSRDPAKAIWGNIRYLIPEGYRICGENMYAEHSIAYTDLESYFYGFSAWDERNVASDWDSTIALFEDIGITPVRELYRGVYDEAVIKALWREDQRSIIEGYVFRITDEIPYKDFSKYVAKFVRKGHVQTDEHWMTQAIKPNKLKAL